VETIGRISTVMGRISESQTTIASAVEEQTATTGETNRNVADAATGVQEIATNVTGVADSARLTSQRVQDVQDVQHRTGPDVQRPVRLVAKFQH
jgi:methyl-accepting chemotaxis protein